MNFQKLRLYRVIYDNRFLSAFSQKGAYCFGTIQTRQLYSQFKYNLINKKKVNLFHITDTTRRRIAAIPTAEINGEKLSQLISKDGETGFVFFNDKLHFIYAITKAGIHINAGVGFSQRISENPMLAVQNNCIGYIYMDFNSTALQYWVNNLLDCFVNTNGTALMKEPGNRSEILKMARELEGIKEKGEITVDVFKNTVHCSKYYDDYNQKFADLKLCLQGFLFIQLAEIIHSTKYNCEDESIKFSDRLFKKNTNQLEVIRVDTLYDESFSVINPFSVKGHFRNQPHGEKHQERKLIWIDHFMKKGYNRTATKQLKNI